MRPPPSPSLLLPLPVSLLYRTESNLETTFLSNRTARAAGSWCSRSRRWSHFRSMVERGAGSWYSRSRLFVRGSQDGGARGGQLRAGTGAVAHRARQTSAAPHGGLALHRALEVHLPRTAPPQQGYEPRNYQGYEPHHHQGSEPRRRRAEPRPRRPRADRSQPWAPPPPPLPSRTKWTRLVPRGEVAAAAPATGEPWRQRQRGRGQDPAERRVPVRRARGLCGVLCEKWLQWVD